MCEGSEKGEKSGTLCGKQFEFNMLIVVKIVEYDFCFFENDYYDSYDCYDSKPV